MHSIRQKLNETLLHQNFTNNHVLKLSLEQYKTMAQTYATIEHAIAVLSDMKDNKSYIYSGLLAAELELVPQYSQSEINSIWEDAIFERMHPDDLINKHILELHFFQFLKTVRLEEHTQYYTTCRVRMHHKSGQYVWVQHRMYYVASLENGSIWLALCLYNIATANNIKENIPGQIIHALTGTTIEPAKSKASHILSEREIEILQYIRQGKLSKEIAHQLCISIHTVNRHRQNILEKLRVDNSFEACRIAEKMDML